MATLRLVDQGKLALSSTLGELLGTAGAHIPDANRIIVAQLLDHSSGIYPTNNDEDYIATILGPRADPHRVRLVTSTYFYSDTLARGDRAPKPARGTVRGYLLAPSPDAGGGLERRAAQEQDGLVVALRQAGGVRTDFAIDPAHEIHERFLARLGE